MTKKDFKLQCSFHEYGRGQAKRNAIYFGWKSDHENNAVGYKFMVKAPVSTINKAKLFNILYDWVNGKMQGVPYWVEYRFAHTDQNRFKVAIVG